MNIRNDSLGIDMAASTYIAERLKKAILSIGTYEKVSELTNISVSTLVRLSSGKTEPKLSDVIKIAKLSGKSIDEIAYGEPTELIKESRENYKEQIEKRTLEEDKRLMLEKAISIILWNILEIEDEDLLAISRQISALSAQAHTKRILLNKLPIKESEIDAFLKFKVDTTKNHNKS